MASTIRGSDNFDSAGGNAVKAWVNFNGAGVIAIKASFNVSSISDLGVGDYAVNFNSALADANYSVVATVDVAGTASVPMVMTRDDITARTASTFKMSTRNTSGTALDSNATQAVALR